MWQSSGAVGVMEPAYRQRERERERDRSRDHRDKERGHSRETRERDVRPVTQKDRDTLRQRQEAQAARLNTRNNANVNGIGAGYQDDGMPVFPRASALDHTDPTAERTRRLFGDFDAVRSLVNKKGIEDLSALQKTNGYGHLDFDALPEYDGGSRPRRPSRSSSTGRHSNSSRHSAHSDRSSRPRKPSEHHKGGHHAPHPERRNEAERGGRKEERKAVVNGVVEKAPKTVPGSDTTASHIPIAEAIPSPQSSTSDAVLGPKPASQSRLPSASPDVEAIASILREMTFPAMYKTLISPLTSPRRPSTPPRPPPTAPVKVIPEDAKEKLKVWGLDLSDSETSSADSDSDEEGEIKPTTTATVVVPEVPVVVEVPVPVVRAETPVPPQSPATDESFGWNLSKIDSKLTQKKLTPSSVVSTAPSPVVRLEMLKPSPIAESNGLREMEQESAKITRLDSIEEGEVSSREASPKHSTPHASPGALLAGLGTPLRNIGAAISPIPKSGKKAKSRSKSTSRNHSRRGSLESATPREIPAAVDVVLSEDTVDAKFSQEPEKVIVESTSGVLGGSPGDSVANQTMMLDDADNDMMDLDEDMGPLIVEKSAVLVAARRSGSKETSPPNWENTVRKSPSPPAPVTPIAQMVQRILKLKPREKRNGEDFVVKIPLNLLERMPLKVVNGEKNGKNTTEVVVEKESTPVKVSTPPTGTLRLRLQVPKRAAPPVAPKPTESPVATPPPPTPEKKPKKAEKPPAAVADPVEARPAAPPTVDEAPQDLRMVKKPRADKPSAAAPPVTPKKTAKRRRSLDSSSDSEDSVGGHNGTSATSDVVKKTPGKLDSILSSLRKRSKNSGKEGKETVNGEKKEPVEVVPVTRVEKPAPVPPPRTPTPPVKEVVAPVPPVPPETLWTQILAGLEPLDTTMNFERQRGLARKLKTEADQLDKREPSTQWKRSAIYLQSVVHFALMGKCTEKNPKQALDIYQSTVHMLNHCRLPGSPKEDTTLIVKVTRYLHFRALAILSMKMYGFNEERCMKVGRNIDYLRKHPPGAAAPPAPPTKPPVSKSPSPSPGTTASPYSVGSTGSGTGSDKPPAPSNGPPGAAAGADLPGLGDFHQLAFHLVNGWWYWNRGQELLALSSAESAEVRAFEGWLQGTAPLEVSAGIEQLARHLYAALWVLRALPEGR
ncbi:titin-like [Paramacrobiotus metropolitanus]|uniref:titin-like n=1 Tax=Paramacrobiotus metropolitanus TaxID=2943436 RepID=UPI00244616BF|nr:titin-like [Paramacrobiotus metropolitanus]XP_055350821.1 titin-like [Paramacrobiotus metropolitanus]